MFPNNWANPQFPPQVGVFCLYLHESACYFPPSMITFIRLNIRFQSAMFCFVASPKLKQPFVKILLLRFIEPTALVDIQTAKLNVMQVGVGVCFHCIMFEIGSSR